MLAATACAVISFFITSAPTNAPASENPPFLETLIKLLFLIRMLANAGISAIVQPGGSIKDQDSIDLCNELNIPMVFTGYRHFRH